MTKILAWHFLRDDCTLRHKHGKRDKVIVKPGMVLKCDAKKLILCEYGLHSSIRAIDALAYAPGSVITKVEASGKIIHGDDKLVSSVRKVLWLENIEDELRSFARWCALQVIHLWDAPQVVIDYLNTGDENLRAAAGTAARADARAAARAAAGAVGDAAWDAAWAAVGAVGDAASDGVWAARDAARDAARVAARVAVAEAQSTELERRLKLIEEKK